MLENQISWDLKKLNFATFVSYQSITFDLLYVLKSMLEHFTISIFGATLRSTVLE